MRNKWGWILGTSGVFVMCLLVIHSAVTGLIVAVDTDQLANVLVGYIACLVIGSLATLGLVTIGRKFSPQTVTERPQRREVIALAPLAPSTPFRFPKTAFVRNIIDSSAPTHPKDTFEFRVSSNGVLEAKTIPAHYVRRFFECATPRRGEWRGNVVTYSELLKIARNQGWVCERTDGENGVKWSYGWEDPQKRIGRLSEYLG